MWPYTDQEADYLNGTSVSHYVSERVFDDIKPLTGKRLEILKRKKKQ